MRFSFWSRKRRDAELEEEIRSHLNMAARDGTPQAARREFGNVGQVKELTRSMWAGASFDRLGQEARFAVRSLRRTPGFAISVILILGLGIGMASAMLTVFQSVLLRRLPVQDQGQLIELSGVAPGAAREFPLIMDQYKQFKQQSRTLESVAGFAHWGATRGTAMDGERPMSLGHAVVTGNFFDVLGAAPALGRLLRPDDERDYGPSTDPRDLAAVISYDTWRREFGGDPQVVGRRIRFPQLKWNPVIVGVAPPGLDYPRGAEVWTPNAYPGGMDLLARLAPGASLSSARAEYLAFVKRDESYVKGGVAAKIGSRAVSLEQMIVGDVTPTLIALTAAVGMLLLLACVNIGNLLLLRAAGRTRELAVRRALGAGSADIVKQLIAESVLLGLGGGLLGLGLASVLVRLLIRLAPGGLPRLDVIRLAPAPLAVTTALTLLAVLLFGVFPALGAARFDLSKQLRADTRSGTEGRRLRVVRRALVGSQVALALMLLAGAGVVIRSAARLSGINLGFSSAHVSVLSVSMPWEQWIVQCGGSPSQTDTLTKKRFEKCINDFDFGFHDQLVQSLHTVAGIDKVSSVAGAPFLGSNVFMGKVMAEGQSDADGAANPWIGWDHVGPEYFDAMGITVLRGRGIRDTDREGSEEVVVVTDGIATLLWPGQDPIGKHLRMVGLDQPLITVVGLVGDMHFREHRRTTPMIIRPFRQGGLAQGVLVMRTGPTLASLLPAIRGAVRSADPKAELVESTTMDEMIAPQLAQPRLNAWLLSAFALVALLLAAIGLYGIMSSAVAQQTRELGVRLALGATPGRLRSMILRQALAVAGAGALVGLLGALAGSRLLTTMLFEVSPTDPVTLIGVSLLLLAVALLAAYLPARRATRIDPARALRAE